MHIQVLFFARARDLVGVHKLDLELADASRLSDLRMELVNRVPALAGFIDRCKLAMDDEYADEDIRVRDGSSICVIPPVSGG
jgi:molybdopterin converting factor subunit 1